MEGIEDMARELVKTYPFLSDDKAQMFKPERETLGSCPRCGSPVYEGKRKTTIAVIRNVSLPCGKMTVSKEPKSNLWWITPKFAASLYTISCKVNVKKIYSPKTGKTYEGTIVLADTGGKYSTTALNCRRKNN